VRAGHLAKRDQVRAQALLNLQQPAFAEQVQIESGDDAAEAVGVVELDAQARAEVDVQAVVDPGIERTHVAEHRLEQAVDVQPPHRDAQRTGMPQLELHRRGSGTQRADHDAVVAGMRPEQPEGVGVLAPHERVEVGGEGGHQRIIRDCRSWIVDC
jgi:hypothetical protein